MGFTPGINLGTINLAQATPATPRVLPYQYTPGIGYPIPYSWKVSGSPSAHFLQGIEVVFLSPYVPSHVEAAAATATPSAVATYQKAVVEPATAAATPGAAVVFPVAIAETATAVAVQDAVMCLPMSAVEPATATETSNGVVSGGGGPVVYDVSVAEMAAALSHDNGLIYPHVITAFNPLVPVGSVPRYSPSKTRAKKNRIYTSYFGRTT